MTDNSAKVQPLGALADIVATARAAGKAVVLCHGVFDVLHVGHVRHLKAAKREGDVLVVTITADKFVNKGPGRPAFPEHLRADMLASLEVVDWVGINNNPSAETVIDLIKPSVYVKGSEYTDASQDVTGKIQVEQNAVERHGGRIAFTHDITFSSSTLINRHLDILEPELRAFLAGMRENGAADRIFDLIDKARDLTVTLIGDTIVDEYQYVSPMGKSSKENMIATLFSHKERFAGGILATANHLAAFCKQVDLITTMSPEDIEEGFLTRNLKPNIKLHAIPVPGRPTTKKIRFIDPGYSLRKLFEVYHMDDSPLAPDLQAKVNGTLRQSISAADLVIVNDFGHGLIADSTLQILMRESPFLAVNAQTNSGNHGYNLITRYTRADFICIDAPEARLAMADKFATPETLVGELLPKRLDCPRFVVTWGAHGCYAVDSVAGIDHIPAFTRSTIDTVGAGDAFFALAAPLAAVGGAMQDVAFVGNAAGAVKVGIVGHRTSIEKVPLQKYLTALLK
jgi:rfaE bifunctional protein nucleotidyltransferase chain/domain